MQRSWKLVSATTAASHPLYGVKNWLVVFAIAVLLGLLLEIGGLRGEAYKVGLPLSEFLAIDDPAITFAKIATGLNALFVVAVYWLLLTKHPRFRIASSWLMLGIFPLLVTLGMATSSPDVGLALAKSFLPWAISCAVWVTYLNRSRRVRVTFEHLVRSEELIPPGAEQTKTVPILPTSDLISEQAGFAQRRESPPAALVASIPRPTAATEFASSDEELWANAIAEFEGRDRRPGLWAKSFAEAKGNESVAKASYLTARVAELRDKRASALALQERSAKRAQEELRLARLSEEEKAYALLPKARCPNCEHVVPLRSEACPKCRALFGPDSSWKPIPLKES